MPMTVLLAQSREAACAAIKGYVAIGGEFPWFDSELSQD